MNTKELLRSGEEILSPAEQNAIVQCLRFHLVKLCDQQDYWLAGGSKFLAEKDGRWVCRDNVPGTPESTVIWGEKTYRLVLDLRVDGMKGFKSNRELPGDVRFILISRDGCVQNDFSGVHMIHLPKDVLLTTLSEGSIKKCASAHLRDIPNFISMGPRINDNIDEKIFPNAITLITKTGHKVSYENDAETFRFQDNRGKSWYPDFSDKFSRQLIVKHGREYLEVDCFEADTGRTKSHFLSRKNKNEKFKKHHLCVGERSFEVLHLVGNDGAQINFLSGTYRVKLNEHGAMISKHDRYIHLSGSSTFWYDLKEGKKLDHEPE